MLPPDYTPPSDGASPDPSPFHAFDALAQIVDRYGEQAARSPMGPSMAVPIPVDAVAELAGYGFVATEIGQGYGREPVLAHPVRVRFPTWLRHLRPARRAESARRRSHTPPEGRRGRRTQLGELRQFGPLLGWVAVHADHALCGSQGAAAMP